MSQRRRTGARVGSAAKECAFVEAAIISIVILDDTTHEMQNTTTPFVDQNQTYSSHRVFLRE